MVMGMTKQPVIVVVALYENSYWISWCHKLALPTVDELNILAK